MKWVTTSRTKVYRCPVWLLLEDVGYSVLVANLPGCGSQGDTEEEALVNVKEALLGMLECYRDDGRQVPWQVQDTPEGEFMASYVEIEV